MALFGRRAIVQVEGLDVSNLRVKFRIARTLSRTPSSAEIDVYNLSEDSRAQIRSAAETAPGGRARVLLLAGYRDEDPHLIFAGALRRVAVRREGQDIITKISSEDGVPTAPRISRSFRPGTSIDAALNSVLGDSTGLDKGNAGDFKGTLRGRTVGQAPLAIRGAVDAALDAVLAETGIDWSVQDGQLQLLERGRAVQMEATVLSSDTGLVGSPQIDDKGKVKVTSLMAPGLSPGLLVRVESLLVNDFFKVESATYVGDTDGQEWQVEIEAAPVRA